MLNLAELQLFASFLNAVLAAGVIKNYMLAEQAVAIGKILDREGAIAQALANEEARVKEQKLKNAEQAAKDAEAEAKQIRSVPTIRDEFEALKKACEETKKYHPENPWKKPPQDCSIPMLEATTGTDPL